MMDECYDINGLRLERHGRFVFMQNQRTPEQQEEFMRRVATHFPSARDKMADRVSEAIDKIVHCDPTMLLLIGHLAMTLNRIYHANDEEEIRSRELEFVQSILVTHKSRAECCEDLDEMRMRCFEALQSVEDLYLALFPFSLYYRYIAEQQTKDENLIELIVDAQMMYLVRGKRDVYFHERYFSLLLKEHDQTFRELFGVSAEEIVAGISCLANKLFYCGVEMLRVYDRKLREVRQRTGKNVPDELAVDMWHDLHRQAEDLEQFNVGKITGWDQRLLEALSLPLASVDKETTYEYQFWPIDDLPIKDKPFVKIGGGYYCFDYYSFVDNIYRALFNVVRVGDRSGLWSKPQTVAIESAVSEVFEKLLPGCRQLRNVLYNPTGRQGEGNELDVVIFAAGMTFVVEAKGVCLQHASPLLNFDKVKAFYENGIRKAGKQSRRFKDYVDQNNEIVFYNPDGSEAWRGLRSSLGKICRMCVTVDSENFITTSTMRLKEAAIDAEGLICISLDDLLVYERYFDAPMLFLAYMDFRSSQTEYDNVSSGDELDYLGLFIHGRTDAEDFRRMCNGDAALHIGGHHEELDAFFLSLHDSAVKKPELYMPSMLGKLMDDIWRTSLQGKSQLAVFLTSLDKRCKDWLAEMITCEIKSQRSGDHQRLRSTFYERSESSSGLSLLLNTQYASRLTEEDKMLRLQGIMSKFNEEHRDLLTIEYDPTDALVDVKVQDINVKDLCADPQKVNSMVDEIEKRVVSRVIRERGVPGRNDPCPCGSGKKYKKCCGR